MLTDVDPTVEYHLLEVAYFPFKRRVFVISTVKR